MIVLDTNVISTVMSTTPDAGVVAWLDGQPPESLWITALSVFEIRFGLELLETGRRRRRLEEAFAAALAEDFHNRILSLDDAAASTAAGLAARRQRDGRPVELRDTLIAGIVLARGASLATRNTRHFSDLDVPVIDPWRLAPPRRR